MFARQFIVVWRKFWRFPFATRTLLIRTTLLLALCRLALLVLPFRLVLRHTNRAATPRATSQHRPDHSPEEIAWAVKAVGLRLLTDKPCLTQALVTLLLFRRRGYPATLHIGVVKDDAGGLKAHAWIESRGNVVVGDLEDLSDYTLLPSLENVQR